MGLLPTFVIGLLAAVAAPSVVSARSNSKSASGSSGGSRELNTCPPADGDPAGLLVGPSKRSSCAVAVDDVLAEDYGSFEPWSYPPFCVHSNSTDNTQFCVYTSASFNRNRGISFIVTPETAAELAVAVRDPAPAWQARRFLGPDSGEDGAADEVPYELVELPGKGMGLVATRKIEMTEVFLVGFPALMQDDDVLVEVSHNDRLRLLRRAFRQLPDSDRSLTLAKTGTGSLYEKIVRANGFEVTFNEKRHTTVYPEISRINHGCDARGSARFNDKSLGMSAFALRDIEAGEEIEFNYIPLDLPTAERQDALMENFGFTCTCSLCNRPEPIRRDSDMRRNQLRLIWKQIEDTDTSYQDAVRLSEQLMQLARGEVPAAKVREYDLGLMSVFYDFHDYARAITHTQAAIDFATRFEEPGDAMIVGLRANLDALVGLRDAQERAARNQGGDIASIVEKRGGAPAKSEAPESVMPEHLVAEPQ